MKREKYEGQLDLKKSIPELKRAMWIYYAQKKRHGVSYSLREFVAWYLTEMAKSELKSPEVGRIDHSKAYSFDNIYLQEKSDNIKERNERRGNPCRMHKSVSLHVDGKLVCVFETKREAAAALQISEKTVYNHCMGKTKQKFKFGLGVKGKNHLKDMVLSWK